MFRRKEEFDFESEGGEENGAAVQAAASDSQSEESASRSSVNAAAAPRPASLSQAPGAAPRVPASAPAPSAFRASTPAPASTSSSSPVSASASASAVSPVARPAAPSAPAPSSSASSPANYAASGSSTTSNSKTGGKRILTVGNDILLKGEIATCDRLVIEGEVDAKLNDVHTVEIAETGSFRGKAEIEDAEISGLFEGELVVRNRLTIYSTGKVRGKISYGEIEIERGGELTGEISLVGQAQSKSKEKAA